MEDSILNLEENNENDASPEDSEYQTLRQEILALSNRQLTVINLGLTATIIFFGYNFLRDTAIPFIFLAPILILSIAVIQLIHDHYSILHIASFIRVFKEGKSKKWESWVFYYRKEMVKRKKKQRFRIALLDPITTRNFFTYYIWIACLTGVLCLLLSGVSGYHNYIDSIKRAGAWQNNVDFDAVIFSILWFPMVIWWSLITVVAFRKIHKRGLTLYEIRYRRRIEKWRRSIT